MTASPIPLTPVSSPDDLPPPQPLVLIVDDEKAQRELLTAFLTPACRVDTAASVAEAVLKAELTPPSVVLMDYAMPGATGIEGLQRLRKIYPELPVLILTGYADLDVARQAIELGAVEYLLKPCDPAGLLSLVLRLAAVAAARQAEPSPAPVQEIPYAMQRRLAANVDLWRGRLPTIPSENRLHAVLESGVSIEAKVLRLNRRTVQAEVYDSNAVLTSGDLVEHLEVWIGEEQAYHGPARLLNAISDGLNRICEFAMSGDWLVVPPATLEERRERLDEESRGFIARWRNTRGISPEFMLAVAGAEAFFRDLRDWLTRLELNWVSDDPAEERAALRTLLRKVTPAINEALAALELEARRVPDELMGIHAEYLRSSLHPLLLCSPFVHRCFTKPLGYPGDFGIMNRMLDSPFEGDGLFARVINAWVISSAAGDAYRHRVLFLERLLSSETARVKGSGGKTCHVLSLGCGAAREVQQFVGFDVNSENASFTLLDFSADAIQHAREQIAVSAAAAGRSALVTAMEFSVQQMLAAGGRLLGNPARARAGMLERGRYDVIYCAGLFDYLSDRICKRLLEIFWVLGAPGATIVASNFAPGNPIRAFMDYVLDWRLIYRDEPAVRALALDASLEPQIRTIPAPQGVEVFLEMRKPQVSESGSESQRNQDRGRNTPLERVA